MYKAERRSWGVTHLLIRTPRSPKPGTERLSTGTLISVVACMMLFFLFSRSPCSRDLHYTFKELGLNSGGCYLPKATPPGQLLARNTALIMA